MSAIPITLAQAAAELPEATPGQIVAALCVMAVMSGSLIMIFIWIARLRNGTNVIPFAARKPLYVPWPLIAVGLLFGTMMAAAVFSAGTIDPELLGRKNGDNDIAAEEASNEPAEAGDTVETETESSVSETASEQSDDNELATNKTDFVDNETDPLVTDGSTPANNDAAGKLSPAEITQRLWLLMISNIVSNLVMFAIFGLVIWSFQRLYSRRMNSLDDVAYDNHAVMAAAAVTQVERFPDLDSPPIAPPPTNAAIATSEVSQSAAILDSTNPFATPYDNKPAAVADEDPDQPLALEKWNFATELLFAFETFLIAYLPTTLIRVLIVSTSPEAKSHPFLEMLENGVDPGIMVMIFLMAVVVAPIVEELMYRVAIFGGMFQRRAFWPGMVISCVLFGMAHGYPDCFALLPLAAAIAFTYSRRRSYRTAVLVHMLFNGFNMLLAGASML